MQVRTPGACRRGVCVSGRRPGLRLGRRIWTSASFIRGVRIALLLPVPIAEGSQDDTLQNADLLRTDTRLGILEIPLVTLCGVFY